MHGACIMCTPAGDVPVAATSGYTAKENATTLPQPASQTGSRHIPTTATATSLTTQNNDIHPSKAWKTKRENSKTERGRQTELVKRQQCQRQNDDV